MKNLVELKQGAYELGESVQSLGDSLDLPKIDAEIEPLSFFSFEKRGLSEVR